MFPTTHIVSHAEYLNLPSLLLQLYKKNNCSTFPQLRNNVNWKSLEKISKPFLHTVGSHMDLLSWIKSSEKLFLSSFETARYFERLIACSGLAGTSCNEPHMIFTCCNRSQTFLNFVWCNVEIVTCIWFNIRCWLTNVATEVCLLSYYTNCASVSASSWNISVVFNSSDVDWGFFSSIFATFHLPCFIPIFKPTDILYKSMLTTTREDISLSPYLPIPCKYAVKSRTDHNNACFSLIANSVGLRQIAEHSIQITLAHNPVYRVAPLQN